MNTDQPAGFDAVEIVAAPIDDTIEVEVLSAAIAATDKATITLHIEGRFGRPGSQVEIPPIVVVTTVPAKVLPA